MQKKVNTSLNENLNAQFLTLHDKALSTGAITPAEAETYLERYRNNLNGYQLTYLYNELELKLNAFARPKDTHAPFLFSVAGETFDVRPLFNALDLEDTNHLLKVMDDFIFNGIQNLPATDFDEHFKESVWLLRLIRNAISDGFNNSKPNESQHLLFDSKFLKGRSGALDMEVSKIG